MSICVIGGRVLGISLRRTRTEALQTCRGVGEQSSCGNVTFRATFGVEAAGGECGVECGAAEGARRA